jgi:hypothetical protein
MGDSRAVARGAGEGGAEMRFGKKCYNDEKLIGGKIFERFSLILTSTTFLRREMCTFGVWAPKQKVRPWRRKA